MKRIYLFLLVFYAVSNILGAQDTIVRTDGKVIIGKITQQDAYNVYFTFYKNGNDVSTFLPKDDIQTIKIAKEPKPYDSTYFAKNVYLEVGLGPSYMINKELDENFNWGANGSLRLRFDSESKRYSYVLYIGLRDVGAKLKDNPGISDDLGIGRLGVQFNYTLFKSVKNNFMVQCFAEVDKSWVTNELSWEDKRAYPQPYWDKSVSYSYFKLSDGECFSYGAGLRVRFYFVFAEAGFNYLNTDLNLSDDYKAILNKNNVSYEPVHNFTFNSFNFNFGLSLTFKQWGRAFTCWIPF